jgi:hypothetical protein
MTSSESLIKEYLAREDGKPVNSYWPLTNFFHIGKERMSLKLHFQLAPFFRFKQPKRAAYMVARQLGKSYSLCAASALKCGIMQGYNALIVQPRFDQVQRLNNTIMKPLLTHSDIRDALISPVELNKFAIKTFKSGSIMYMDYCFMNPDRIRGISGASHVYVDECQDVDYDHLGIIGEVVSASKFYGFHTYTGTPKTTDGTLGVAWDDSSQAEWVIPCQHCNLKNIPSIDQHLIKMIGKKGCICAKCGKPLDARDGSYVHAFPEKQHFYAGYHLSQVVHPLHYTFPNKWRELHHKMNTYGKGKFYNEVLGVPCDESVKLLSLKDLVDAGNSLENDKKVAMGQRKRYEGLTIGVDWSGGGEMEESFTSVAVVGFRPGTDVLDCIYAERFPMGMTPEEEAKLLMKIVYDFNVSYFAHDYGGAGHLRESLMRQAGLPEHQIIPFTYIRSSNKNVITYNPPRVGVRYSYSMDKARSLAILSAMLRSKKVTLPQFNTKEDKHVIKDLLNLVEMPREMPGGSTVYLIGRKPKAIDDFAHALNYACSAIWHTRQAYPNLADVNKFSVTASSKALADPSKNNW